MRPNFEALIKDYHNAILFGEPGSGWEDRAQTGLLEYVAALEAEREALEPLTLLGNAVFLMWNSGRLPGRIELDDMMVAFGIVTTNDGRFFNVTKATKQARALLSKEAP